MTNTAVRSLNTRNEILRRANTNHYRKAEKTTSFKKNLKNALVFLFDSKHESPLGLTPDMQAKMYLD